MPSSSRDDDLVAETIRDHSQKALMRFNFESQWEETSQLIFPEMRNTFRFGNYVWPGQKKAQTQVDASGMLANTRFSAICDSMMTPRNGLWHGLGVADPYVMKDRQTRLWFEEATKVVFSWRYRSNAGFVGQQHTNWLSVGAFGNQYMFIDRMWSPLGQTKGLRYKSVPVGEVYVRENHQGIVDDVTRWFRLTARQCWQKWGFVPEQLKAPLAAGSETTYNFLHRIHSRADYDPEAFLSPKGKPWASVYVCLDAKCLMAEEGYRSWPLATGRYMVAPGEVYGRGPAQQALPSLKTANAEKQDYLKVGHRTADPTILTSDDGIFSAEDMIPGAIAPGTLDSEGRELVKPLPIGNLQIVKEMLEEERSISNDLFLVSLFLQSLDNPPQMTATEIIERINEKGILAAPTLGRQVEYTGPMVEREVDELSYQNLLPPMPPRLLEARRSGNAEMTIIDTSPLAKMARAGEAAGFMRSVESVKEIVAITGDPEPLDNFNFDVSTHGIADIQSVPESWMSDAKRVAQKRSDRAKAQQQKAQNDAAPAQAAMMKAQAVVQKTQMQTGAGQPTPRGSMPFGVPGQQQPQQLQQPQGMPQQ